MRYLTRVYAYDHVGRVIDNHGPNGLPLRQSYSYDQFDNMQGRWGTYYFQGFRSQSASYINNRRTAWSYDAEGHVTNVPASDTDAANTFTYDAAGRLVMRVETTSAGATTFNLTYDGDGEAVSAATTPSGSASTVGYDIRSSVFGEVLTELDQSGNKRSTHIQADGLLFASQSINSAGASIQWTIRNPVGTGERNGSIYDPLGNYIPFQHYNDPRPPAGSYNSASMSSLAASQANPDSYGVGCMLDGLPTSCNRVLRANNGEASKLILYGPSPDVALANMGLFLVEHPLSPTRPTAAPSWRPHRPNPSPGNPAPFNTGRDELEWGYSLVGFYQPQTPGPCELMARFAQDEAEFVLNDVNNDLAKALPEFDKRFAAFYLGRQPNGEGRPMRTFGDVTHYMRGGGTANRLATGERLGQSDFRREFYEISPRGDAEDQTHHFAAYFSLGINNRPISEFSAKTFDRVGGKPDKRLGDKAYEMGQALRVDPSKLRTIGNLININICR